MIKQVIEGEYTSKYIFFNGSEISFKRENSASYDTSLDKPTHKDKNKYSLVLSCSVGCNIGCKFCHLTQNQKPTKTLSSGEVTQNIKDVISDQLTRYPELSKKAIKLCWMGEGEPLLHSKLISETTQTILDWVFDNGYASYLDGVDIATSYPKVGKKKWQSDLYDMKTVLQEYPYNPYQDNRTCLRMFYSLHDSTQEGRNYLIPTSSIIPKAVEDLKHFCDSGGIDLIIHYMFIDGINDSGMHLLNLVDLYRKYKLHNTQLRILRYNSGVNGWEESEDLETCLYWLRRNIPNLKVQYSSGKEIKSSCGMFTEYSG